MFMLIAICLSVISAAQCIQLPSNISRCKFDDAECLKQAIGKALHNFKDGNPKIHMAKVDPLHITAINIDQGADSPVSVKLDFLENDLTGLSDAVVTKIKVLSKENVDWDFDLHIPLLSMFGDYKVNGRVLVLPIAGQGLSNLTMVDAIVSAKIKGSIHAITKNGKKYHQIDSIDLDIKPKKLHIFLGNLFNGDKALGDNMNVFLNENWQDIYVELKPAVEESFSAVFKAMANAMYLKVPYEDVFLTS